MKNIIINRIIKTTLVIVLTIITLIGISKIVKPKFLYNSSLKSPESEMWKEFYSEPKDSIDVLFVGNSHLYNGVNPAIIYKSSGITSYDLSTSAQNLVTAYYVLSEGLKYQNPEYVVLDASGIYDEYAHNQYPVNYRRTFDDMRWSLNKLMAINEAYKCINNPNDETTIPPDEVIIDDYVTVVRNRIFPVFDYHSRWEELTTTDFDFASESSVLKGYCTSVKAEAIPERDFYNRRDSRLGNTTQHWFEMIKNLCDANNATLIVIGIPFGNWCISDWELINDLCSQYGVPYIDYNIPDLYVTTGISYGSDYINAEHLNCEGSSKFSVALANSLINQDNLAFSKLRKSDEWDKTVKEWNDRYFIYKLKEKTRLPEYLEALSNEDCIALLSMQGNLQTNISEELRTCLTSFGCALPEKFEDGESYTAVIQNGNLLDSCIGAKSEAAFSIADINNHDVKVIARQADYNSANDVEIIRNTGNGCSISVDDVEWSLKGSGLNLVVYSVSADKVIDSIVVDIQYTLDVGR